MAEEKNVSCETEDRIEPEEAAAEEAVKEDAGKEASSEPAGNEDPLKAASDSPETDEKAEEKSGEEKETDGETVKKRWKGGRKEKKELEKKEAEIAELTDKYKRTLAEYDNFRRRTEKEKADLYGYAVRDVMTKILPVLDNLERGIAAVPEDQKEDPIAQGMEKILRQFEKALEDTGVKPIETAGKTFDPNLHNAVMHIDDENFGENEIVEEFQKGYTYHDQVVRHSMVKVAN